jgi:hypothetical protein
MSGSDQAEGGRAEPIDVDFEPAERPRRVRVRRTGVGMGTVMVVGLVSAAAGAAGGALAPRTPQLAAALDQIAPAPDAAAPAEAAAQAEAETAALDARLQALEQFVNQPVAEASSADAAVGAQIIGIQSALSTVQGRLEALPSNEEIRQLTTEVASVRDALPSLTTRVATAEQAARSAVAVAAATDAARVSGSFEDSYAALVAILPQDPNVIALAPLAQTGAPTRIELRDRFEAIDLSIVRAAVRSQAAAGLWGRVQAASAEWIVVRRRGEGDTTSGIVERASARLAADDLAGAVTEVERLTGAARQVAAPWLVDARRRLEIENRLAAIRAELSRRG